MIVHYDSPSPIFGTTPLCSGQETAMQGGIPGRGDRSVYGLANDVEHVTCPDCKRIMEERRVQPS